MWCVFVQTDLLAVGDAGGGGEGLFEDVHGLGGVDVLARGAHHQTEQHAQLLHEPQVAPLLERSKQPDILVIHLLKIFFPGNTEVDASGQGNESKHTICRKFAHCFV